MEVARDQSEGEAAAASSRWWRWPVRVLLGVAILLALALAAAWFGRERIAENVIDSALEDYGLEASYDIVAIEPYRQVISNLAVGDPSAPDLTIERLEVEIEYGWFSAGIANVTVEGARLFGTFKDGTPSFGALDTVLFAESDEPFAWPEIPIRVVDARGRIDSDFGAIGFKLDGTGSLGDDFAGTLAATAPGLAYEECRSATATVFGAFSVPADGLTFTGPARLRNANCSGALLESADIGVDLTVGPNFDALDASFEMAAAGLDGFDSSASKLGGQAQLSWKGDSLSIRHDLALDGVDTPYGALATVSSDGIVRSAGDPVRTQWNGSVRGEGVQFPVDRVSALSDARAASAGTLIEPLLAKLETNLVRAASGGRLDADITARTSEDGLALVIPEARLSGADGRAIASVSRVSWAQSGRLTGNILTTGPGLPQISGRMEQDASGELGLRLQMQEYVAGDSRLALPSMTIRQTAAGQLSFDGTVQASGAIPGGSITGLEVPINGGWSSQTGLRLGQSCTPVSFAALSYYDLSVDGRVLSLCPGSGGALVSYGDSLSISGKTSELSLSGEIAGSPISVSAAGATLAFPGEFELDGVDAIIGEEGYAVRIETETLLGRLGEEIGGSFSEGRVGLDSVPFDFDRVSGEWQLADYVLSIEQGTAEVTERLEEGQVARLKPLITRGATFALDGNDITLDADLREPLSDNLVTTISVNHDLGSGEGNMDLSVPGLSFGRGFEPDALTPLTEGLIADVVGTITGHGEIRWTAETIDSEGTFGTENLALSAAFGPADGISGQIRFTDLIALTTAENQTLTIGALNPGIEVLGGKVTYEISNGEKLSVKEGRWPFMGGELLMRPVEFEFGPARSQRYIFEVIGLEAGQFIAQMEMTNLAASGVFDGTVPIIFDEFGNGTIEGGLLISRAPGGNVSYVGDLVYEDMGSIANFAFQSLRSLDFTQMSIELSGNLAGVFLSNFRIDGVSQGDGADRNFVTRQLAKIPIRFNVSVRSSNFYELATVLRGIGDASYLGNPVERGLITADGERIPLTPEADSQSEDESPVQAGESDGLR